MNSNGKIKVSLEENQIADIELTVLKITVITMLNNVDNDMSKLNES